MPSSNVRPPPPVVTESVVKTEVKDETDELNGDVPKATNQRKVDSEPEKKISKVKEEVLSEDEDDDYNDAAGKSLICNIIKYYQ